MTEPPRRITPEHIRAIARLATKQALRGYELPGEIRGEIVLGEYIEGPDRIFELYLPGHVPEDARVLARVVVNAETGIASPVTVFLRPTT